jgi:photosystem II stability/assembly factor-like uncharacterized protein
VFRSASVALVLLAAPSAFAQPATPSDRPNADAPPVAAVQPTPASARLAAHARRADLSARSLVQNVPFRNLGPTVMSGRVVDLDANPADPTHFYAAYASGGLWRTETNGTDLQPLFDDQAAMTLGDVAVRWNHDPEGDGPQVWVGTGENNSSRSSYAGTGVYRSDDGGKTWTHAGLAETQRTGRIVLHPDDPETLWVAAAGPLYARSEHRGVYRSTDGGASWQRTLFVDDTTGVIDLVPDPSDPNTLYASTWTRTRRAWNFREAGPGSGVWKSTDGGVSWNRLSTPSSGLPTGAEVGRIGLAVYPADPQTLYAVVDNQARREKEDDDEVLTRDALQGLTIDAFLALSDDQINGFLDANSFPLQYDAAGIREQVQSGELPPGALVDYLADANAELFDTPVVGAELYRSDDGGASWRRTHDDHVDDLFFSYGYYFGEVRVSPQDPDRVYLLGVPLVASSDGGRTFAAIDAEQVHVDHHALWINPSRPGHLISGNDGGVNVSYDDGASWTKANPVPVGQFYTVQVDDAEPYNVYGGLQDNGVWRGPSTYEASRGWLAEGDYPYERLLGGDGMQIAVDPRDGTVFTGFQFGNYYRIEDGVPGEAERITPRHDLGESPFRFNWQTPIHLSIHTADVLYMGSQKLHRSTDGGKNWTAISGDLTRGGQPGDVPFGTLTSLSESPLQFGRLWAGSDDGLVHFSADGGHTWRRVSDQLPADVQGLWVSRVEASHHDADRAYVSLNGYRDDHHTAYVFRTDDAGATWQRIGTDLPLEPVNVVREDPANPDLLYLGTDHGLYASVDRGGTFMAFMGGSARGGEGETVAMPNVPVHDLAIQHRDKELVVGTHGRSIWAADISHLQRLTDDLTEQALYAFETDAVPHRESWGSRPWQWADPMEPEVEVGYWSAEAGRVRVEVRDSSGVVHAEMSDDAERGLNYVRYDLTTPSALSEEHEAGEDTGRYYLLPGTYTVRVERGPHAVTTDLAVEPGPEKPVRGRKKTP